MSAVGAFDSNFQYVVCIDTHLNRREWGSLNVEGRNREHGSNGRNQNRVLSHSVFSHLRRSRQYKRAFTLRAMVSNLTSNDNLASIPISPASRLLPRKVNRLISFSPSPMTVISHSWVSPMSRSSKTVELKK
jgi:hypothetical protein